MLFGSAPEPLAGLGRANLLAAVKRFQAPAEFPIEFRNPSSPCLVVFFEQPQRFPDNSLAEVQRPVSTLALTNFSSWGVRETFMDGTLKFPIMTVMTKTVNLR